MLRATFSTSERTCCIAIELAGHAAERLAHRQAGAGGAAAPAAARAAAASPDAVPPLPEHAPKPAGTFPMSRRERNLSGVASLLTLDGRPSAPSSITRSRVTSISSVFTAPV